MRDETGVALCPRPSLKMFDMRPAKMPSCSAAALLLDLMHSVLTAFRVPHRIVYGMPLPHHARMHVLALALTNACASRADIK